MAYADPNPLASIAYASCMPLGVEPPFESDALSSRAAYERLNRAAARAETLVLYRLDQLAAVRDSLDVDQERLEKATLNLWRLTAIRKTLMGLETVLNAPAPTAPHPQGSFKDLSAQLASALKAIVAEDATTDPAATPITESSAAAATPANADPCESASVGVGPCSSVSPSPSPSQSPSASPSPSPASTPALSSSIPPSPTSVSQSPSLPVPQSPSSSAHPPQSELRTPQPLALSLRAVPSCPKLSPNAAARALGRVNADMAQYPVLNVTAEDSQFTPPLDVLPGPAPLKSQITNLKSSPADSPNSLRPDALLDRTEALARDRPPD